MQNNGEDNLNQKRRIKMRTQETIMADLKKGKFESVPQDVMTIKSCSNMICNTIDIHLTNAQSGDDCYFCISNKLDAWKWLKQINEVEARSVLYQIDDNNPIKFEESLPYKSRFEKGWNYEDHKAKQKLKRR